jgi:hypothetical protein
VSSCSRFAIGPRSQSITRIGVPSVADAVFGQADTAPPIYLSLLASTPVRPPEKRILTSRPLGFIKVRFSTLVFLRSLCVEGYSDLRQSAPLTLFGDRRAAAIAGLLAARPGAPSAGVHSRLPVMPIVHFLVPVCVQKNANGCGINLPNLNLKRIAGRTDVQGRRIWY